MVLNPLINHLFHLHYSLLLFQLLYLDDIRNPHQSGYRDDEWIVCRNDKTFKDMFMSFDSIITHLSFDNDLANFDSDGNEVTGYDCVKWL